MKTSVDRVLRGMPRMIRNILSVGCLTLLSCGNGDDRPEALGTTTLPIIQLDPPATMVAGVPSTRSATCPGHELPDQCGSWAGVELHATRTPEPRHGWHHHECRHHGHSHHTDVTTDDDEHCLCEPIDFVIPSELPVTAGQSGGDWDKAELSFRTASGKFVKCEYRGNYQAKHGKHPASGGDKYLFQSCNKGFKVGQGAQSDWFQLELGDGHGSKTNVEVSLRLGEPDVVGGVVQEQVFYADDARVPGAALHVPRGSAPPFESFSLDVVPQVAPGSSLENGGDPATSVGYPVDVHSDSSDTFAFTPVPGTCPRIELPYDPARLEALLGPGHERSLNASHLTSVAAIAGGGRVLEPMAPVTVDLANHLLSFCVEHLSIYLANTAGNSASIRLARLYDAGTLVVTLVDQRLATDPDVVAGDLIRPEATVLPGLVAGNSYDLQLQFNNNGNNPWTVSGYKLVAVDKNIVELGTTPADNAQAWVSWRTQAMPTTITKPDHADFTFPVSAPSSPGPMNFCLRSGTASYFGECFSWDAHIYGTGTGQVPPCVVSTETCNGKDDDCDGFTDEDLMQKFYVDADSDGYGDPNSVPQDACEAPMGYVANSTDCDDGNAGKYPAAYYPDCDGDGIGKDEICYQPQAESTPFIIVYPVSGCIERPASMSVDYGGTTIVVNYVTSKEDCNNYASSVYPGAPETCDYVDSNCSDGINDEAHTVSWSYDHDFDTSCQGGSVPGCPNFAPNLGMRESSQCVDQSDCNDLNNRASTFCEFPVDSDTFGVSGGLIGTVDYRTFHVDCPTGWHISRCDAAKTGGNGNVSIAYCPEDFRLGDPLVRFGVAAFQAVSGHGTAYCTANAGYLGL